MTPAGRFYKPELDCLRFLAFLGVFVRHSFPGEASYYAAHGFPVLLANLAASTVRAGGFGVDLFFVLSAYLITELLLREFDVYGTLHAGAFLVRRALRIWPLFFLFLAIAWICDRYALATQGMTIGYIAAFLLFLGNWSCVLWGFPSSVAALLWSVSIEEQFYLAWPFALSRLGRNRVLPAALTLIFVAVIARPLTVATGAAYPAVWCSTLCRLDTIAAGILLALFMRRKAVAQVTHWPVTLVVCAALVWSVTEMAFPVGEQRPWAISFSYPVVALASVGMLVGALSLQGRTRELIVNRLTVYLVACTN